MRLQQSARTACFTVQGQLGPAAPAELSASSARYWNCGGRPWPLSSRWPAVHWPLGARILRLHPDPAPKPTTHDEVSAGLPRPCARYRNSLCARRDHRSVAGSQIGRVDLGVAAMVIVNWARSTGPPSCGTAQEKAGPGESSRLSPLGTEPWTAVRPVVAGSLAVARVDSGAGRRLQYIVDCRLIRLGWTWLTLPLPLPLFCVAASTALSFDLSRSHCRQNTSCLSRHAHQRRDVYGHTWASRRNGSYHDRARLSISTTARPPKRWSPRWRHRRACRRQLGRLWHDRFCRRRRRQRQPLG